MHFCSCNPPLVHEPRGDVGDGHGVPPAAGNGHGRSFPHSGRYVMPCAKRLMTVPGICPIISTANVTSLEASLHCQFLIRSRHYAKTYSARHARGRRPRRSTRRPKALLPPRQTALVEAVHIFHIQVHIQDSGHVLLSWVVSTHEGL